METALFLKLVDKVGAENILCIVFDLGDRIFYREHNKFDKSHVDTDTDTIIYETDDSQGIPVKTYHPISKIHHIFTVNDAEDLGKVRVRYLLG